MIQDDNGKIKLKMLGLEDVDDVRQQIENEQQGKNKIAVGLHQMEKAALTLYLEGNRKIDLTQSEVRSRFLELLVQAKFVAGTLEYRPEELPHLRNWLEKVGPEKAYKLFQKILHPAAKSESRNHLPGSQIGLLFREFGQIG